MPSIEIVQHTQKVINHLCELGFLINLEKSSLTPRKQCVFLGVFHDLDIEIILPSTENLQKLEEFYLKLTAAIL